jgi:hypothetical protein
MYAVNILLLIQRQHPGFSFFMYLHTVFIPKDIPEMQVMFIILEESAQSLHETELPPPQKLVTYHESLSCFAA